MTARDQAAQDNNQGVDFLEKGQYDDAISVFKNTLHAFHTSPSFMKVQETSQHNHFSESPDIAFTQRSPSKKRLDQILQLVPRDETSFIYCCAFRISMTPARHEEGSTLSVQDTMVIIFNLSLVLHFQHLATPVHQRDPKNLTKALHCYSMVQALILAKENQRMLNDPIILLILMASSNNMGQLQHSVGDSDAAVSSMKLLSSTLALWQTTAGCFNLTIDAEDLRGFNMNLIFPIEPVLAPAA